MIFTRIYNSAAHGDKAALAGYFGKSLEWISRMTRTGGEDCPSLKYLRWFSGWSEINPTVADRMHEELCRHVEEIRRDRDQAAFSPRKAAADILTQAALTVNSLNDGTVDRADVEALTALKIAVDGALGQIAAEKPVRFMGVR